MPDPPFPEPHEPPTAEGGTWPADQSGNPVGDEYHTCVSIRPMAGSVSICARAWSRGTSTLTKRLPDRIA